MVNRVEGAKVADVTKAVRKFAAQKTAPSRTTSPRAETACEVSALKKTEPLEVRLKKLLTSSRCMVFMKGDPSAPKCGFSRQVKTKYLWDFTKLYELNYTHKKRNFLPLTLRSLKFQTIELFQNLNADFGTFDILTDDEIRQGLKTYSTWPTYPQIYIDGQLIGGKRT